MADPCIYTRNSGDSMVIIVVWVDDCIVAASNETDLNVVKNMLKTKFKMTDLKQLSWFLGIEFKFENDAIKMNQTHYLKKSFN